MFASALTDICTYSIGAYAYAYVQYMCSLGREGRKAANTVVLLIQVQVQYCTWDKLCVCTDMLSAWLLRREVCTHKSRDIDVL